MWTTSFGKPDLGQNASFIFLTIKRPKIREKVSVFLEKHGDRMKRIIFNVFKDSDLELYEKILGWPRDTRISLAKRQTKDPVLRRNINCWLADNCFGDYYTHSGLNDQEREMITFCFLLAQGGCENQLKGHTAGNFGVGNDNEKLHSVVEQCMPYIGYPRSLNAMNIIDEVSKTMEER